MSVQVIYELLQAFQDYLTELHFISKSGPITNLTDISGCTVAEISIRHC